MDIRAQIADACKSRFEEVRNIRRDGNKHLEKAEKEKTITEDDLEKGRKQIDDITREFTDKIDGRLFLFREKTQL